MWINEGNFQMGCSPVEEEHLQPRSRFHGFTQCRADEFPVHEVTISHGFWLEQREVTVDAYFRFSQATGTPMPPDDGPGGKPNQVGNDPVVNVSWDDATAYCGWAGMRLPTEAEWEYAVTQRHYNGYGPQPVGRKPFHIAFDLRDLTGKSEWTADWYGTDYYAVSDATDPQGPAEGDLRVIRGGSDGLNPGGARVSRRVGQRPGTRSRATAFRCAGQLP
jgi:formylglycine-generating enzyme required for sulfatase activity